MVRDERNALNMADVSEGAGFAFLAEAAGRGDGAAGAESEMLDLVGIGFGPANLSLAIATEEENHSRPAGNQITAEFVETQPKFGWHDGMLLPDTDMQISFLKDLVSLRNPTSDYSFLNYLQEHGRLTDFINLKTFFPSRREFHDYLSWAAARVSFPVHYGRAAADIEWNTEGFYEVELRSRASSVGDAVGRYAGKRLRARNIVFGVGIEPTVPLGVNCGPRVFHNHRLLSHLGDLPSCPRKRFLVVGAGQSAAEVIRYLHENYPDSEVHSSFRRFGYTPSDDTPYANRVFDPSAVDDFYRAPADVKQKLLDYHWLTNYSAVDADLIEILYKHEYEECVAGRRRLFTHRVTEVQDMVEHEDTVSLRLIDRTGGEDVCLEVDAVIYATGFQPRDIRPMLGLSIPLEGAFEGSRPVVERDYRLRIPGSYGHIYLNGGVEHTHGLSSSLLSNVSVRSADILATLRDREPVAARA